MARLRRMFFVIALASTGTLVLLGVCLLAIMYTHHKERRQSLNTLLSEVQWHDRSPQSHTFFLGGGESIVIRNDSPEAKDTGGFVVFPGRRFARTKEEALDWLMSLERLESGQVDEVHDIDYDERRQSWLRRFTEKVRG